MNKTQKCFPQLEVIIDHLVEAKRDENEARRKLTSFAAIAGWSSNKRQASCQPPKAKKAKRRLRPEAIALRPAEGKTYVEILSGIRCRVNPTKCGTEIKAVRKTRSWDVFIEIRKTTVEGRKGFTDALKEAIGESSSVRVLVPRMTLEIRGMDSCTTVKEVELALWEKLQTYEGKLEVRLSRPNAVGQHMAVFSIKEEAAARLLDSARTCIGWQRGAQGGWLQSQPQVPPAHGWLIGARCPREMIPDVSLATESLAAHVREWQVIKDFTASDHQYTTFRVRDGKPAQAAAQSRPPPPGGMSGKWSPRGCLWP